MTAIDRKLNLIVPVERETGTLYVHAMPLSQEVFERYYLVISKTFAEIHKEGLGAFAGPRIAAVALKDHARAMGIWDGPEGVEAGLFQEIIRLCNVAVPKDGGGWQQLPLHTCLERKLFAPEEVKEVQGAVTFFMVSSAMHKRSHLEVVLNFGMGMLWGTQTTSLTLTDWLAGLSTSIETESGGEKGTVSVTV